ncbi:laminin subunit alpha-3 [Pelobates cultripes]|uniref:Laminin subunit alpha-3 n=1 Tax=Pelobates cultripes TaxID=61616 RepID=A0AAD1S0V6_PELCU|nr:laminin subunit alpha-3 [Pelobates cultripes]
MGLCVGDLLNVPWNPRRIITCILIPDCSIHCAALWRFVVLSLMLGRVCSQDSAGAGTGFSLHPPYFNLAEGARILATATCGEESVPWQERPQPRMDLYCKLVGGPSVASTPGHTIQGQPCDFCYSADPNKAHPVSNAIDGTEQWWQSPPLSLGLQYNEVNVTIDLGQLFHVAYVLIKFANSPRPDLWVLERSVDFGRTYIPWQYFAHSKSDCFNQFGKEVKQPITKDDDVICTTEYSRIVPLENGEVVVSLVNGRPGAKHFMDSPILRDFTKATNIRLRFLRTNTLLGHLISKAQRDPTVTRRYYYSIKDISIGGRCVCHGHADVCSVKDAGSQNVYHCQCQHNTCGEICDRCCPGYHQKPWRPASVDTANACELCNCHGHASDCYYDANVDYSKSSLDISGRYNGGGVCINCQHNTAGVNCELCAVGYYRPYGVPREAPDGCIPCSCNPNQSDGCEEGSGICYCKPNFRGVNCEQCADGYFGFPDCFRIPHYPLPTPSPTSDKPAAGHIKDCQCSGRGVSSSNCDRQTGHCLCRTGYQSPKCDSCDVGYFLYPYCQKCECNPEGVLPAVCDHVGRCLCQFWAEGEHCDQCKSGYHSFPRCRECSCDMYGAADPECGARGECQCRPNFAGLTCDQCGPGYYSYPSCMPCQCSQQGSYKSICDPVTGQCDCHPGVVGRRCDRCSSESDVYPVCQDVNGACDPAGTMDSQGGHCQCLSHVEGVTCNRCKPLYWNLARENPNGCTECNCEVTGTISGVGECHPTEGYCHCKPHVCSSSCDTCKDGYFLLEDRNYFGCTGCQCDVGGAVNHICSESSGKCICKNNIEGINCNIPKETYYFPDLYQIKFEIEDGTTKTGRGVRFGYDPNKFPGFSWRGYAEMTSIQNEVRIPVTVEKSFLGLFRIILKYINPELHTITGRITATPHYLNKGILDSKDITFPPSREPAFITVPGKGFAEPFSLSPGSWVITITVEGVLLDYLVLLPSDYYEASILKQRVTQPCTYYGSIGENCLVYQHLTMDTFSCVLGIEEEYFKQDGVYRPIITRQPTLGHPTMAHIIGRQVELQLQLDVPGVGSYVLVLEYANEDSQQYVANMKINNDLSHAPDARVILYSCKYSFLCRSVVLNNMNQIAVFQLQSDVEINLHASSVNFLLHRVCIIPVDKFSIEYAEPKLQCVASYGQASNQSVSCILPPLYENPPLAITLDSVKDSSSPIQTNVVHQGRPGLSGGMIDGVLLQSPQNHITLARRIPHLGRYVFIAHYHQEQSPSFPVSVIVRGGVTWSGSFNASFCPNLLGCRELVIADNRIGLDITNPELSVTLEVPQEKSLVLAYILMVPGDIYRNDLLQEKPLDKSSDFINICGQDSFYIDPVSSPEFCRNSAISLVASYNNGTLPCSCNLEGATSPSCNMAGGQCNCRLNIIGRTCSRCATGYYGFPYCRPCNCGRRLCDELTGRCICPPKTIKPNCEICEQHSFSFHPLTGCEECNCSKIGVAQPLPAKCDGITGQCICKPRISGRQCDRCSPGYFGFPDCFPCDCNPQGTEFQICNPETGACLCKENVGGSRCEVCNSGSFYYDPTNPKGCTKCFCFGATDICQPSNKHRKKFEDMRFWNLKTSDDTQVAITFNPGSNSVVADTQELPPSIHTIYWVAPQLYLGDKISSYGGFLTYQLKSFGLPSEGMILLDKRPDVLLTGRQMTVVYVDPNNPLPDRQYYGRVQLVEGNFRHANSNSMVTRGELMMILSRLESLHIRALYFSETQRLTLSGVGLEFITLSASGKVAYSVETCSCPPEYKGDSCQECAPGHYRDNNGLFMGRCVPCRCNGHSTRCHDGTGICINCQQNTAGDNCELCKEGYIGNATHGTCRLCPCPLSVPSNSFATGCSGSGRNMQCFCKPGYTGISCETCAPGYYGNPLKFGSNCQPCNCGNNGHRGNCDSLTGECLDEDPKDTNGDEESCDSCVNILLLDLSTMRDELNLIQARLQNMGASSQALEKLKALEARIRETQSQYESYNNKILSQKLKVDKLETDTNGLKKEIAALLEKASQDLKKYEALAMNAENTFQNASHLLLTIDLLFKNINILVKEFSSSQGSVSSGDASKNMAEVLRMLSEMRKRNLSSQKREAENEKEEAKALLSRVRNQFQKHQDQHKQLMKDITKSISDYEAKLKDLREALDDASGQTKQANNINKDNAATLEDLKKRIKDLTRQQKEATTHLNAAETSLGQTGSMLRLLQKSKEDYEKLAAQMDGAKQELNEKVTMLSKAASKEPLVIMAEKHAQSLQNLANQLAEIKKNTSSEELVKCAINATNAYGDIINAVKEADEASKKAKEAADSALKKVQSENLPGKAKKSNEDSEALLDQAKKTQKSFQGIKPELEDLKDRLVEANDKKKLLSGDLTALQTSINDIKRDDIENMINNAKDLVINANEITNNVLEELEPIEVDVENLKKTIGTSQNENFNSVLIEASTSVKNLTNSLPDLFEAMNRINNLMPLGNISEDVSRIRELIQQARDAANKIAIPMRFNGTSGVEVRPPTNLEDLKAYTSFSFFLQRPQSRSDRRKRQLNPNMFVMYLGSKDTTKDYMGFAIEDDRLLYVYNLGGNEARIHVDPYTTDSNPREAIMDRVVLERIYQHATLEYIKSYTSTKPDAPAKYKTEAQRHTLFDLDPSDAVFYVAGYPADFRPPSSLNYPNYKGCIEFDFLNQIGISLYNFKKTFNLNTTEVEPCSRHKEESERSYFEGYGYARLTYRFPTGRSFSYEQTIQSTVDNGLLLFAEDKDNYISLNIENGIPVLKYKLNSDTVKEQKSSGVPINTGSEILISLRLSVKDRWIRVFQSSVVITVTEVDVFSFTSYYMGGVPPAVREKFNIKTPAFRGCVKNVKTPAGSARFQETYGVSRKCFDGWNTVREAEFSRGGTLGIKSDKFPFPGDFQTSFGYQTPQKNAMMLTHTAQLDDLRISLEEGTVTVNTRNTELQSTEQYLDGKRHYVTVIRKNGQLRLLVDDEPVIENEGSSVNLGSSSSDLYFGGNDFEGCLSNVFIQRTGQDPTVQNLFDNNEKKQVSLGSCMVEEPPMPLILNEFKVPYPLILNDNDMAYIDIMTNRMNKNSASRNVHSCSAYSNVTTTGGAYQFGDSPESSMQYELKKPISQEKSQFSLEVRTVEASGLIFTMIDNYETTQLTLHISKGRFVFTLGTKGNKLKIRSQDKYNDGKWHTVVFSWDGFNGRLVVDGLKSRKGSLTRRISLEAMSSVHLGGVPSLKLQGIPKKSFVGCMRNVQVNGTPLERPSQASRVIPCYDGASEKGVFFAQDGGHIILAKSFVVGPELEIVLYIRPQSQTGVLVHTGNVSGSRLSLYMDAGKVTLSGSQGANEFQVSLTPLALCDGQWHRIKVTKKENVLKLEIDEQSEQTSGPRSATYTNTAAPLYIGGVPATLQTTWLPVKSSFVGCMKDVKMNKKTINFSKISELSGAISLSRCPAA